MSGFTQAKARDAQSDSRSVEIGIGPQFMPVGWFGLDDQAGRSFRAYPALGGGAFVDYKLFSIVSIGLGVQVTGNVIPNRSAFVVGTMYDSMLRFGIRYPTTVRLEPYAVLMTGYSVIALGGGMNAARGFMVGSSAGVHLKVAQRHRLFTEIGYQHGFQTFDGSAYSPRYLVARVGWILAL